MNTRVAFDHGFLYAVKVRGLTIGELDRRASLSPATASAAVHRQRVNVRSAVLLARTLASCPVIRELEEWVARND